MAARRTPKVPLASCPRSGSRIGSFHIRWNVEAYRISVLAAQPRAGRRSSSPFASKYTEVGEPFSMGASYFRTHICSHAGQQPQSPTERQREKFDEMTTIHNRCDQ